MSSATPADRKGSALVKVPSLTPKAATIQNAVEEADTKQRRTPRIKVFKNAFSNIFKKSDDKED
jgi:hypothetical protein